MARTRRITDLQRQQYKPEPKPTSPGKPVVKAASKPAFPPKGDPERKWHFLKLLREANQKVVERRRSAREATRLRDDLILQAMAEGVESRDIADWMKIERSRIYQIMKANRNKEK